MRKNDVEFKIKKQEYENRTFRLPKELLEQIQQVAQQEGISMNEYIVQAALFSLKHYTPNEKKE